MDGQTRRWMDTKMAKEKNTQNNQDATREKHRNVNRATTWLLSQQPLCSCGWDIVKLSTVLFNRANNTQNNSKSCVTRMLSSCDRRHPPAIVMTVQQCHPPLWGCNWNPNEHGRAQHGPDLSHWTKTTDQRGHMRENKPRETGNTAEQARNELNWTGSVAFWKIRRQVWNTESRRKMKMTFRFQTS